MGQLTIYLPDALEQRVRRHAKRAHKSVSAYLASLEDPAPGGRTDANGHPVELAALFGSLPALKAPADPLPEIPDLGVAIPDRHRHVRRVPRRR